MGPGHYLLPATPGPAGLSPVIATWQWSVKMEKTEGWPAHRGDFRAPTIKQVRNGIASSRECGAVPGCRVLSLEPNLAHTRCFPQAPWHILGLQQ
jgi:hypothetical protein